MAHVPRRVHRGNSGNRIPRRNLVAVHACRVYRPDPDVCQEWRQSPVGSVRSYGSGRAVGADAILGGVTLNGNIPIQS